MSTTYIVQKIGTFYNDETIIDDPIEEIEWPTLADAQVYQRKLELETSEEYEIYTKVTP